MEYMVDFSTPLAPAGNLYNDFLISNDLTKDDNYNNLLNGLLALSYTKQRFNATASIKLDYTTNVRRAFWPMALLESVNFVSNYSGYNQRIIGETSASYLLPLADIHKLNIQWNGSITSDLYHYNYTRAYDGDDDMKPTTSTGNFKQYRYVDRLENRWVSTSIALDYKYKNLLNVGLLARYDGNSAIQSDHRWMFTPAASAEWNLKNHFFTGSTALSGLSLRASYARIAKSFQSDRYELGPQYLATSITWSGEPLLSSANGFATITRPYASGWVGYDLKLPYSDKMELALKGSFFDNRIIAEISLYKNYEKNLLTYLPVTQEMGYEYKLASGMDISNQGLELNLSASILKNTPLKWDLSFNASYNKNKLEKLPENQKTTVIGDHKLQVGQSVDAFWVYQNKGIYTNDSEVPVMNGKPLNINGVPFKAGDPVYRMITSEDWSVIVPLSKETAIKLKHEDVSGIKVRMDKDSETLWGKLTVIERQGKYYGQLDFDNSMIRYAEERFLNIELIMEDESGLKIPKSSVVNEKFFIIPKEYITTGGNSSASGVMLAKENGSAVFHAVNIYDISENGDVFVSKQDLEDGSVLVKPESSDTFVVGKTKNLQGVYNINKGYAVFRKVSVLCENDEYYIVQENEPYGLSNYDHIVQEGSSVNSNDVVFQ